MNILVFQHVASEHPGSFREVMAARDATMTQIELDEGEAIPAPEGFDALLVMGGPMDVWQEAKHPWLIAEKNFIRDWVAAQKPYLGICLGAQLLADACGGAVGKMEKPEVGVSVMQVVPDRLFEGVAQNFPCLQWHGAEVKAMPKAGRLLATNAACPVQAFAIGGYAYGLQFHMELTATTATEWADLPEYAAALERVNGPGALPALQADIARIFPSLHDAATTMFGNFLDLALQARA
jgi:GMP synthase-like glutamine amidotransferase